MRAIATGSAVLLIVLGVFLIRPAPVVDLDHKVCDLLTGWAGPGEPSGRVVIVDIDEKSLAQFGRWPWPRDLVGLIARSLLDHGASAVVLDMMFPEEDRSTTRSTKAFGQARSGTNDEVLAEALSGKPVVAGYAFRFDRDGAGSPACDVPSLPLVVVSPKEPGEAAFFHASGAVCSIPVISRAAAANGFLNAAPDSDGKTRRIPLVIQSGDRLYPSLALAALNVYRPVSTMQLTTDARGASRLRLARQSVPLEGPSLLRLRFRGARRSFAYVSVADVLGGRARTEMLRGRIAIVGGSAQGLQNPLVTPVDPLFPDVEIQATAIDNLLQGDSFRRPGDAQFWELALALLAGLISVFLLAALPSVWGVTITVGIAAAAWTGCAFVLSFTGMLFSPLAATAALACNLPVLTLLDYLRQKSKADRTQRQLVSILESISDGFCTLDRECRYTYINPAGARMSASSADELLGRTVWEVWPHLSDSAFEAAYRRVMDENALTAIEAFYPEPLNAWFEVRCYPSPDGLAVFFNDVTARKRAEQALRESEERHRALFECMHEGFALAEVICDEAGAPVNFRYLEANPALARMFRRDREQIVGRTWRELFPEAPWQYWVGGLGRVALTGESAHLANYDAGTGRHYETAAFSPAPGKFAAVLNDVTDRRKAEQALRESEAKFRTLANAIPQLCWMANADGWIFWYNQRWFDYTGTTPQDMEGWGWQSVHDPRMLPSVLDGWKSSIATGERFEMVFSLRSAEGVFHPFLTQVRPVHDDEGKVVRWFGTNTDIAEQRRTEEALRVSEEELRRLNAELEQRVLDRTAQLEASNEELEAFAYSVSHDLRAPLRGIDGWSLALLEDHGDQLNDEARQLLARVRSETQRMGQLIDDLLQLSRLARAKMNTQSVDLTNLAHAVSEELRESNPGRDIEFAIQPGLSAVGDAGLMEVALTNLLSNAVKFTGKRASARVAFGQMEDGTNAFYVRDNGVGFDMAYADMLFGAFQRLHKASEFPGTGIGLATVQRIVRRHGGRVWAEARPNEGATFYFVLASN